MKRRLFYIPPQSGYLIFSTEGYIAASGGAYSGFNDDGSGEEEITW